MTAVQRWDEWFGLTGDEESVRVWQVVKEVYSDNPEVMERWATIVELNRLGRLERVNDQTPHSGVL